MFLKESILAASIYSSGLSFIIIFLAPLKTLHSIPSTSIFITATFPWKSISSKGIVGISPSFEISNDWLPKFLSLNVTNLAFEIESETAKL